MSTIITRTSKASPLTFAEVDANFTNLNSDKTENSSAAITGGTINGTVIGATTAANGNFTNITATGGTINGAVIGATTAGTGRFTSLTANTITLSELATSANTPSANTVTVFGKSVGGRILPAFIGPSGLDATLQPHTGRNKIALATPNGGDAVVTLVGLALTATGTASAATTAATNRYTWIRKIEYLVTVAATTAVAGFYSTIANFARGTGTDGGFHYVCRFGPATGVASANRRLFVGMSNLLVPPTDVNPSTLLNMIGVGYDSADTNIFIMHNDGAGTATKVDTSIVKPSADRTIAYELALFAPPGAAYVDYEFTQLNASTVFRGRISTDLPAATTFLAPRGYTSVGGTSSVTGLALMGLYIETDY
jgi:hypothetical protein